MKELTAADALSQHYLAVSCETRPHEILKQLQNQEILTCAVFDEARFLGLVDFKHIVQSNPQRIFADLLPEPSVPGIKIDSSLDDVSRLLKHHPVSALPVLDPAGTFTGVVSRESLLYTLSKKHHHLLKLIEQAEGFIREVNRNLDLESMLNTALRKTLELIDLNTGWVFLYDEVSSDVQLVTSVNLPGRYQQNRLEVMKGNCSCQRRIFEKKEETAIVCLSCERGRKIRSELRYHVTIPLVCYGRHLGVMNLACSNAIAFSSEELNVLSTLGKSLGIAIMNSQSFQRLRAEQERSEQAYRQSEEYQRIILSHIDEIVYMVSTTEADPFSGQVQFVSPRVENIIGYKPEDFLNDPTLWFQILHPEDIPAVKEATQKILATRKGGTREYRIRNKQTQKYHWLEDRLRPQLNALGQVVGLFGVARDITERKQAEETLQKLSSAVEQTADHVFITNKNGVFEYVNPAFLQCTGYTKEECLGQTPRILKSDKHDPKFYQQCWQTLLSGAVFSGVFINRKKNGQLYDEDKTITPIRDAKGHITHFVSTGRDVTEHKRAETIRSILFEISEATALSRNLEELLSIIHQQLGTLIDTTNFYVALYDDRTETYSFPYAVDRYDGTEFPPQQLKKSLTDYVRRTGKPLLADEAVHKQLIEQGKVKMVGTPSPIWLGVPLKTASGVIGVVVVQNYTDPSAYSQKDLELLSFVSDHIAMAIERKLADEALRQSQQKYESLVNFVDGIVWEADAQTFQFSFVSKQAERLLGYPIERWLTEPTFWKDHLHPDDQAWAVDFCIRATKENRPHDFEYRMLAADGRIVWLRDIVSVVVENDQAVRLRGIMVDITEHKRAEEALRASEEKYRTILETIEDGYYEVGLAGNFTFFNDSICKILGYPREELPGMNNRRYTDEMNARKLYRTFNRVYTTGQPDRGFDWEIIRKDGSRRSVEASVSLIKNAEGNPVGFRGIVRDITERKQLEEQMRHAQKMETIGSLTGGVAHDFNNLLTVILGNAEFGLQDCQPDQAVYQDIIQVQDAAIKARDLTTQLLTFGRKQVLNKKLVHVNKCISELVKMIKRIIAENIILETDLQTQLPPIWADPISIQQLLMNICVNARDAMPNGGKLTLTTREVKASEMQSAGGEIGRKPGNYVQVSITDTGVGMDKTTRERIFEPFFTTKEVGKGTGLGLSVVYGIVKQHDGDLEVLSEPGKGTTFHIYLPVATEDNMSEQEKTQSIFQGEGETVLVVEDDEAVRNVGVRLLKTLGCNVMTAKDGEDALETFKNVQKEIDLIIMDVVMPKASGPQVFSQMRALKPTLPVVFATGYDVKAELGDLVEEPAVAVLQKPFSRETLGETIQRLLSRGD